MQYQIFTTTEYAYLIADDDFKKHQLPIEEQQCFIPTGLWECLYAWLQNEVEQAINKPGHLKNDISTPVMELATNDKKGRRRLLLKNYVGLLVTNQGSLEILPKIVNASNTEQVRAGLARMLYVVQDLPYDTFLQPHTLALNNLQSGNIFELIIAEFLTRVSALVRKGLLQNFASTEANLPVLKGRLDLQKHLSLNNFVTNNTASNISSYAKSSQFYVHFDELTSNLAENKIIKTALQKVLLISGLSHPNNNAKQLLKAFLEVDESRHYQNDLNAWNDTIGGTRGGKYYRHLKPLCSVILQAFTEVQLWPQLQNNVFLFPSEKLFERYVAKQFQQALISYQATHLQNQSNKPTTFWPTTDFSQQTLELKSQLQEQFLFTKFSGPFAKNYAMRPDILISAKPTHSTTDKGLKETGLLIMDTKWKCYNEENNAVAQADLYQMLAYGSYYLQHGGHTTVTLAIIAPATEFFNCITGPHPYALQDKTIELWMLPFDLLQKNRLVAQDEWPKGLLGEVLRRYELR